MKSSSVFNELSYAVNTHRLLGARRIRSGLRFLSAFDGSSFYPAVE